MKKVLSILIALSLYGVLTSCSDSVSGDSIIDEPESSQFSIDLSSPEKWTLASVPADPLLFPESSLNNDVNSGKNRALLAWNTIDRLFTARLSDIAPGYIRNDLDALSYPYAREVSKIEVFPDYELDYGESPIVQTMNLSFYPRERGPYNLDGTNVDQDGSLLYPERRWGGIMRSMDIDKTNFEQASIKYIRFWLLDPFMDTELGNQDGGYLYFNLGEVSEDILKDGLMSCEYLLPFDGDTTCITTTAWGKISNRDLPTYAFSDGPRLQQDVGLDGLTNQEEFTHPSYTNYLNELRAVLSEPTYMAMLDDPSSPFNDPAGDDYYYYRNPYYDYKRFTIIERYKQYNGTDGNSLSKSDVGSNMYEQGRSMPDVEDINYDKMLNQTERFFQYRIAIHPDSMRVGGNFITDKQVANVQTRNGETQVAVWYQFTIPLNQYQKKIGSIQDFSNIRYVRMFMTGFRGTTHLRFATLELVSGE